MTGRPIATMMMTGIALLLTGGAEAGTFKAGAWVPTGCGAEPTPPAINASGHAAYEASIKDAEAYQRAAKQYDDCYVKEAQADNHVISTAVSDHQHQIQATFDKLSADSKAVVDKMNKKQ
ncbi:MAG TPA: hypothetical protein VKQ29_13845 [Aliidongia sp.]|nr:hypothetical protein [Aliidongia sp.]